MAAPARFHWAKFRVSCHGTESQDKVTAAVRTAAGDAELPIEWTPLESHHGGLVHLGEATLEKNREVKEFLGRIAALPGGRDAMASTIERRTDDEGVFYFRLDKQAACLGDVRLVDGEDCIQVRIKLETYPSTREAAVAALAAWWAQA